MVRSAGSAMGPRELVSLDIEIEPVCDLTVPGVYNELVIRAGLPPHPDFFVDLSIVPHNHCQALAAQAREEGFTALLVPSAAETGEKNLIIYVDVVAPKHVKLENGPDRIAL